MRTSSRGDLMREGVNPLNQASIYERLDMNNLQIEQKMNKAKDDLIHLISHTHLFFLNEEAMAKAEKLRTKISKYEATLAVRQMAKDFKSSALSYERG